MHKANGTIHFFALVVLDQVDGLHLLRLIEAPTDLPGRTSTNTKMGMPWQKLKTICTRAVKGALQVGRRDVRVGTQEELTPLMTDAADDSFVMVTVDGPATPVLRPMHGFDDEMPYLSLAEMVNIDLLLESDSIDLTEEMLSHLALIYELTSDIQGDALIIPELPFEEIMVPDTPVLLGLDKGDIPVLNL